MASFTLRVNGESRTVSVESDTPLLYVLRNDLELNGPKFGCGLAQCGACTVLVDDKPVRSCVTPVASVAKGGITTIEGLGSVERLHPLQRAFIEEQACQCGYCGNGMVMSAKALLDRNPRPSDRDVKAALNGHLCRCASHNRIVPAVQRAASEGRPCAPGPRATALAPPPPALPCPSTTRFRSHPLQRAFIEEQACQCGYCGNGMVMSAKALLDRNPRPSDRDVKAALNGHLCRCASHNRISAAARCT